MRRQEALFPCDLPEVSWFTSPDRTVKGTCDSPGQFQKSLEISVHRPSGLTREIPQPDRRPCEKSYSSLSSHLASRVPRSVSPALGARANCGKPYRNHGTWSPVANPDTGEWMTTDMSLNRANRISPAI